MKLRTMTLLLPLILTSSIALADEDVPNTGVMPLSSILQHLQAEGYKNIKEIEWEHQVYEAKVFDQNGQELELKITPQTGAILNKPATDTVKISLEQAVIAIEKAGYSRISDIERKKHYYKAKAMNAQGKKIKLHVDITTGAVSQGGWFD